MGTRGVVSLLHQKVHKQVPACESINKQLKLSKFPVTSNQACLFPLRPDGPVSDSRRERALPLRSLRRPEGPALYCAGVSCVAIPSHRPLTGFPAFPSSSSSRSRRLLRLPRQRLQLPAPVSKAPPAVCATPVLLLRLLCEPPPGSLACFTLRVAEPAGRPEPSCI